MTMSWLCSGILRQLVIIPAARIVEALVVSIISLCSLICRVIAGRGACPFQLGSNLGPTTRPETRHIGRWTPEDGSLLNILQG